MLTDIYPHLYTSYIELIIAYSWTICRGYVSAFGQANINAPTHTHTNTCTKYKQHASLNTNILYANMHAQTVSLNYAILKVNIGVLEGAISVMPAPTPPPAAASGRAGGGAGVNEYCSISHHVPAISQLIEFFITKS